MKKFILIIGLVFAAVTSASAMNLKEAFNALSNLPNIEERAADYNLPVTSDVIENCRLAAAYNLNAQGILDTGNATFTILNQVPLMYMINGACNNQVAVFIYTTPNQTGSNDILIAVMSGYKGSVVFMYGTISNEYRDAIQAAPVEMEGSYLKLETKLSGDNEFRIELNKAR